MNRPAVGARSPVGDLDPTAILDAVSVRRIQDAVEYLASDPCAGRQVGSPGAAAGRQYLEIELRRLGAQVRVEEFPVDGVPRLGASPDVFWSDGHTEVGLAHRRDVVEHLASADLPEPHRGRLTTPDQPQGRGGWLLPRAGMPLGDATALAVTTGAHGLVVPRGTDAEGWMPKMLAGPAPGPLPVIAVRADVHEQFQHAVSAGHGAWLQAQVPQRRVAVTAANLHAQLTGGDGVEVLLTAHYDGVGDDPGQRLPAASDNATGVAVVLEVARLLSRHPIPGLRVQAAFLDGEEVGATGSAHHASQLAAAGAAPLVINVDGAGHLADSIAVEAGGPADALLQALDQAGRRTRISLSAGPMASDNRRYAAAGLAAIGLGAGMPGYHTPADTPDRVEADTLTTMARLVLATVWQLATLPDTVSSLIGDRR